MNKSVVVYSAGHPEPLSKQVVEKPRSDAKDFVVFFRVRDAYVRLVLNGTKVEIAMSDTGGARTLGERPQGVLSLWQPECHAIGEMAPVVPEITPGVRVVIEDVPGGSGAKTMHQDVLEKVL